MFLSIFHVSSLFSRGVFGGILRCCMCFFKMLSVSILSVLSGLGVSGDGIGV